MSHDEKLKEKGNVHFKEERYEEAVDCYTEALNIQPENHLLYSNRSASYSKLEKYDEALVDATRCITISPRFARGHLRKATALNGLGRHEEAMAAAEQGYKLRGSDKICRDCVTQWLASTTVLKEAVAVIDDIPPGTMPVSQESVQILSHIQSDSFSPSGFSIDSMKKCLQEVVTELERVLNRFGHSLSSSGHAWITALAEALKADPRTHMPPEATKKLLSSKTDEFIVYINSHIDPILFPIIRPIIALGILSILTCVSTLSQVISFRSVIQLLLKSCLPFFDKFLSENQYVRLHIDALQQLLNSFCMESGHAKQRDDMEKEEVFSFSQKLEGLLQQYPSTSDDYSSVQEKTLEVLENASILLSPLSYASSKPLTEGDASTVKAHVAKEEEALQSLEATRQLHFRDMDSLIFSTGGLVHLGEANKAKDVLKLCESLYFKVIMQLFKSKMLSLDAEALFHPQVIMQANAFFLVGIDDVLLADFFMRWKSLSSDLYAVLVRLGVGNKFLSTFHKLEQLKVDGQGKSDQADVLANLADQHQIEVGNVLQEWGPKIALALSKLSCQQIQTLLNPEEILLEFCSCPLYETKCYPVPIPPKCLGMRGVLVAITANVAPLVRVIDFDRINDLSLKVHNTSMKAVAAKRAGKPWLHLHAKADEVASNLLQAMIPEDVQALLTTHSIKRVFLCPDQLIAKFPVEILPLGDSERFGERYAISYLSSSKQLLRESVISSLYPTLMQHEQARHDCILFANPNFNLKCPGDINTFQPWSQLSSAMTSLFSKPAPTNAPPLLHSETEAEEVKSHLSSAQKGALHIHSFFKDEATLHQVLQVQNPLVLHFATHGFSSPEFHYQYRSFWTDTTSGLLLAGANTYHSGKFDDIATDAGTGELTSLAACGMALHGTRLVYLSTCRSTYGFIGRGEALSSLAQSFCSAGAQTVVATLWPVSDNIAQKMASYFYSYACKIGTHPSDALRNAKKRIKEEGYDHWYDWAAFVCVGIDTPLFSI